MEKEKFTIMLSGRIDSVNAPETESEIFKKLDGNPDKEPVFDASGLQYISSAGLRVLMKVKKRVSSDLLICEVSPEIYEIFDSTGFTDLFNVKKKYRRLSVDGCKVIGTGFYGTVYRYDNDTIVKKYKSANALSIIEEEKRLAKIAFVAGIPTAISFDIVRIDDTFGSVFELLKSKTFMDLIIENPSECDTITKRYIDFLKSIHSIEIKPGELPTAKDVFFKRIDSICELLPGDLTEKIRNLILTLPEDNHFIHGDYQMKNVMLSDDEPMLIDMDCICTGQPIFDLQGLFITYWAFSEDEPENSMNFLGISNELREEIWKDIIKYYFPDKNSEELSIIVDKIKIPGYVHFLDLIYNSDLKNGELGEKRIKHTIEHLTDLCGSISDLNL